MNIKVNRKDIEDRTDTPALNYCRKLLEDGVSPDTRLEIYRDKPEWDYVISSIGEGAKWTVEHNKVRPYRKRHRGKDLKGV